MQRRWLLMKSPKRIHPIKPSTPRIQVPSTQIIQPRCHVSLLTRKQIHVARASHLPNRPSEGIVDVGVGDDAGSVGQGTGAAEAVDVIEGFACWAVLGDEVQPMDVGNLDHTTWSVFLDHLGKGSIAVDQETGLVAVNR